MKTKKIDCWLAHTTIYLPNILYLTLPFYILTYFKGFCNIV